MTQERPSIVWPESNSHYDLVVIGSGPGGQRAAVQAAKLGKKVLIIEKDSLGGSCLHKGTIPSKTLREVALRMDCGPADIVKTAMEIASALIRDEKALIEKQLLRNKVEIAIGCGSFVDQHSIRIENGKQCTSVKAENIVIATGTRPHRPSNIDFSHPAIFDSDSFLSLRYRPKTLAVFGAGVVGCEYASIMAKLGTQVSIFDKRSTLLKGTDHEIIKILEQHFKDHNINLELGIDIQSVVSGADGAIHVTSDRGKFEFEAALSCMGRIGNVELLDLAAAGLSANARGVIEVNRCYQTEVPHIYAVGDIQGSPALATSAAEQGRIAAASAFSHYCGKFPDTFPYGIYTIPEISSVGIDEESAQTAGKKIIVGRARYQELARGRILGDEKGLLKLLFCAETEKLLGAHCIGSGATELIHIGQVALALGADVNFFLSNVFNYPTLAEGYKVAGYNAFNQIQEIRRGGKKQAA